MKNREDVQAYLYALEGDYFDLQNKFDSYNSDNELCKTIASMKDCIDEIAKELELEDETNVQNQVKEKGKTQSKIGTKVKLLKGRSSLLEKIEKEYAEIEKELMQCVSGFEFVLDESSSIKDLTLNRTYSLGSDKLQLLTDDLNALKQKLKQAEMMEDFYRSLEE